MNIPEGGISRVVNGVRYDTTKARLIASRNQFLYRTPKGRYFLVTLTQWQGERNQLTPLDEADARQWYKDLPKQEAEFESAFPGVKAEEASDVLRDSPEEASDVILG